MKRLDTYSQNFLRSPKLVNKLIGHSTIKKTDTVLDIGAGSGIISAALASRSAQVIAYEYDSRLVKKLRDNLAYFDNVTVAETDFLSANLPSGPYKIFANIPFHLSSPILRKITEADNPPRAVYLIVQKQFAHKLIIDTDRFTGVLGAQVAPRFTTRVRYVLQRTDFQPAPAVDTVLVELRLRDEPLLPISQLSDYRAFVDKCFSRQKFFATLNVGEKRPSELTTQEWLQLYQKATR